MGTAFVALWRSGDLELCEVTVVSAADALPAHHWPLGSLSVAGSVIARAVATSGSRYGKHASFRC